MISYLAIEKKPSQHKIGSSGKTFALALNIMIDNTVLSND